MVVVAKTLQEWLDTDVKAVKKKPIKWLSENYFFRDPSRALYLDSKYFFSPADGLILYQEIVEPGAPLVEIKGKPYTLRQAIRKPKFDKRCLVIGIFMSFYDVHVNRIPYSGTLSFKELPAIDSLNHPMLAVEEALLRGHERPVGEADYLFSNQRMLNTIRVDSLGLEYYVLQIADYDVDTIMPFSLKQNHRCFQCERFSQIRYGSQVDLIIPLTEGLEFETLQNVNDHVEAGIDPLVRICINHEPSQLLN